MITIPLPEDFTVRMKNILGGEFPSFLRALAEVPCRGIRLNPIKETEAVGRYERGERIPWAEGAYLLETDSQAGATALHEAGAFYLQEPGAMIPAAVLDAQPGERILDLCAAPGGKSTQIGCAMRGSGLLVANEPVPKRAQILSRNIERMGIGNAIVTCTWPEQLAARWPETFDAVLADAPCSGEGMFRRVPESRLEWTREKASGCAERQRAILAEAAKMVSPGGRLVYSTCTYNPEENEENVLWFLRQFSDFESAAFALTGIDAPEGRFICYPHRMKGEGQFTALFRRKGRGNRGGLGKPSMPGPSKEETAVFRNEFPALPEPNLRLGNLLAHLEVCPDLSGIRVLRAGMHLGEVRGKVAVPDHAAALSANVPFEQAIDLTAEETVRWLTGETLDREAAGWVLMRWKGLGIGWGKGSGGVIRNHYPKGLRGCHFLAEEGG